METIIVEAKRFAETVSHKWEVEVNTLSWEERKRQVKNDKNEEIFHIHKFRGNEITAWFSVTKIYWTTQCHRVIRKLT